PPVEREEKADLLLEVGGGDEDGDDHRHDGVRSHAGEPSARHSGARSALRIHVLIRGHSRNVPPELSLYPSTTFRERHPVSSRPHFAASPPRSAIPSIRHRAASSLTS